MQVWCGVPNVPTSAVLLQNPREPVVVVRVVFGSSPPPRLRLRRGTIAVAVCCRDIHMWAVTSCQVVPTRIILSGVLILPLR